ncbi:hypothetical protein Pmani_030452 [Petrolisthes manimaculis]|uniref:Uncharacterized protein n=1 Tax=Petrolisthes manimaculis TaxID=1843537 RepID=A0AAE1NVZ5_9EUCA|nr:hypothetical protein Pmani_030452 [Petrolisthes manimaculis]
MSYQWCRSEEDCLETLGEYWGVYGSVWEWWGVYGSGGECMGVVGSVWGVYGGGGNVWEWWGVYGSGGECMGVVGSVWEWWGVCGSVWEWWGVYGSVWGVYGSGGECMGVCGSVWGVYGSGGECMGVVGGVWECMGVVGSVWECVGVCGSVWGVCGSVWECVGVYGECMGVVGSVWEWWGVYGSVWEWWGVVGSDGECMGVVGSVWECVGVVESVWEWWECMGVYESVWECMGVVGRLEGADPRNFTELLQLSKRTDLSDLRSSFTLSASQINNFGILPQKFIVGCTYDKKACSYRDFYMWQSDSYGNCFTFNSPNLYRVDNGIYTKDDYVRYTSNSGYQKECQCANAINDLLQALQTPLPRCNPTNLTQELCRQLETKKERDEVRQRKIQMKMTTNGFKEHQTCDCPPACELTLAQNGTEYSIRLYGEK